MNLHTIHTQNMEYLLLSTSKRTIIEREEMKCPIKLYS